MTFLLFFLLVETLLQSSSVGGTGAPNGMIYAAAPAERGAFHVGGKGVYNYGYNTGDGSAKVEVRHLDGSVTGSYRYFDPLGRQILRSYIADKKGFRVLGNELPVAPNTPAIGVLNAHTLTGPVEGTQEFSSPNIVTSAEKNLIFQDLLGGGFTLTPSGSKTDLKKTHFSPQINQKQIDLVNQQKFLIKQHEKQMAELKTKYESILKEQERKLTELRRLQPTIQNNYQYPPTANWITKSFGADSPYFYSDDRINYDFPAGFAYHTYPSNIKPPDASLFTAVRQLSNHETPSKSLSYRPFIAGHER